MAIQITTNAIIIICFAPGGYPNCKKQGNYYICCSLWLSKLQRSTAIIIDVALCGLPSCKKNTAIIILFALNGCQHFKKHSNYSTVCSLWLSKLQWNIAVATAKPCPEISGNAAGAMRKLSSRQLLPTSTEILSLTRSKSACNCKKHSKYCCFAPWL